MSAIPLQPLSKGDVVDDVVLAAAHLALQKHGDSDEPLSLFNLSRASQKYAEWRKHLHRVTPHYAVKCNPDRKFMQELQSAGCNFDCATMAEIGQAMSIGASADGIVFSHPCKRRIDLQYAKAMGVRLMSFDNSTELQKVAAVFPGARLLLRLVCEDSSSQCPMSSKFGALAVDWDPLLSQAAELKLNVVGVSFHVGSGCKDPESFQKALSDSKEVFELASTKGFSMEVLDIGGGYPGVDTEELCFEPLAMSIAKQLEYNFPLQAWPNLRIIAEPGRFFACSAATLLTKVIAKAKPSGGEAAGAESTNIRYYLNDGVYGSFNCLIYDHAEVEPEMLTPAKGLPKPCWVFGPTCDGFDVILKDYSMPELQEGDWLMWRNMGAYTSAAGSNFNGFALAKALYFNSEILSMPMEAEKAQNEVASRRLSDESDFGNRKSTSSTEAPDTMQIPLLPMSPSSPESTYSGSPAISDEEVRTHTVMHFQRLQEELSIKGSWARPSATKWLLLLFCSFIWATKTISFSWAASRTTFSPYTPPIVQSAGLALCTLIVLAYKHGIKEVQLLANQKYVLFGISGFLEGLMFCLQNLALTKVPATMVTVLMQGQFFVVMLLQASLLGSFPSATQIVCVASAICLLFSYQLATSFGHGAHMGETNYNNYIMPAFGAAFCSGACDLALEYFAKRSMSQATNKNADLMRCLVVHEAAKIPIACLMLFVFDTEYLTLGIFHGWDYSVVLGGVGASALALVFVNTSVVKHGALPTNLALSLEVGIVYLLDVFALRTDVFNFGTFLQMCCFAGLIAAYNLDVLSSLSWEANYLKASNSVRNVGHQLTGDFSI